MNAPIILSQIVCASKPIMEFIIAAIMAKLVMKKLVMLKRRCSMGKSGSVPEM
jgi:hypothetical protein